MLKKGAKRFLLGFVILLFVPIVHALETDIDLGDAAEAVFGPRGLGGILRNEWGVYGLTLVFYYMLFYAAYASALRRVKIFEGEGGLGLNRSGTVFAHAITGLTTLAIFAFKDASHQLIQDVLSPMGFFGALVLATVFFLLIYRNWRDGGMRHPGAAAAAATGLLMLVLGELISIPAFAGIGMILFLIGLVAWVIGFARSRGYVTPEDERADERAEEATQREFGREAAQGRRLEGEVEAEESELQRQLRQTQEERDILRNILANLGRMQPRGGTP